MEKKFKKSFLKVKIDKKLDNLSNIVYFKEKLDKANKILAESGVPS